MITFAVLNVAGLVIAIVTGGWHLKMARSTAWRTSRSPGSIWLLGALGRLPRVKPSTKGEGHERRYFYGSVWAVCWAQPALWLLWKVLPQTRASDVDQAGGVPRDPGLRRKSRAARPAAAHPSDRAGRARRLGLAMSLEP